MRPSTSSMAAEPTVIRGACPHDCPDTCAWEVTVRDGVAEKLVGVKEHPFTRGGLCAKVSHFLERTYSPDRLRQPLMRTGPKGSGAFEPVSWDVALAHIAERLRRDRRRARRRGGAALQLRRHPGARAGRLDGPALLRAPGRLPAGAHDLRAGGRRRAARGRRHARRAAPLRPRCTAASSCCGGRTRSSPTCTSGRSSSRRARRERGWWSSIRCSRAPPRRPTGTCARCRAPTPRWRSGSCT